MEKVLLTREQAEALESALENSGKVHIVEWKVTNLFSGLREPLNNIDLDTLIRALYVGYELEPTPEEKIKKYFKELQDSSFISKQEAEGVLRTLAILKIKINGVNC